MKFVKYIVLIFILAGTGAWFYMNRPTPEIEGLKTEYDLTSHALFTSYTQNESEGNKKFLGKVIEVEGTIQSIQSGDDGSINVTLESGDEMFGVSCKLNSDQSGIAEKYIEGQVIKIKGKCSGLLMDVVLVDCIIISE